MNTTRKNRIEPLLGAIAMMGIGVLTASAASWTGTDTTWPPTASQEWAYNNGANWGGTVPQDNADALFYRGTNAAIGRLDTTTKAVKRFVSDFGSKLYIGPTGNLVVTNSDGRVTLGNTAYVYVAEGGQISWSGSGTGSRNVTLGNGAILDVAGTINVPTIFQVNSGTTMNILPGASIGAGTSQRSIQVRGTVTQSGGAVALPSIAMWGGTYTISGGSIATTYASGAIEFLDGSVSSTFKVVGSVATSIQFQNLRYNTTGTKTWAFELDNGTSHITPVEFFGSYNEPTLRTTGTLDVGLRGGVLLSGTNAFTLIQRPSGTDTAWGTGPGALWTDTTGTSGTRDLIKVALAGAAGKGTLNRGASLAVGPSSAYGYVELSGVALNEPLNLQLDITGGTLANLTTALTAAGITWKAGSGGYDVLLTLDPATSGATRFAWDLTAIDSAMSLQGLQIVPKGTMIAIQ